MEKTGAIPQGETLNKIASYFGVTTDYLLNGGLSLTSQTHLASGVHIFKSVAPLGLDDSITENLTPDSFDIVYRDSTSLIVVDKGSNVPKSQLNEIIRTYSSHGKEEAPAQKGERAVTDDDIKFALWGTREIDDDVLDQVKSFAKFARENRKDK